MPALPAELLTDFRARWTRMWAEHPDGLPGEVLDATKEELVATYAAALHGHPDALLPVLQLAASTGAPNHAVTYEFPMLLMDALTRVDEDGHVLAGVADDRAQPWFLRRTALEALGSRAQPAFLPLFRRVLRDGQSEGEVRKAALFALVNLDDVASLDMIRALSVREEPWLFADAPLLEARGRLGDLTATRDLIVLAADPWPHRFTAAQQGLAALEDRAGGLEALVRALEASRTPRVLGALFSRLVKPAPLPERLHALAMGDPVDAVRGWAAARLAALEPARAVEVFLQALRDPDWRVLKAASDALAALQPAPVAELQERMTNTSLSPEERYWAARTLLLLEEAPDLDVLPNRLVPVPPAVPQDVREPIVRVYTQRVEEGTDVRWLIEALTLAPWEEEEEHGLHAEHGRVVAALRAADIAVGEPVEAGEWHQQGGGTYVVLPLAGGDVALSTLGQFGARHVWGGEVTHTPETIDRIRVTLASVGWRWLDEDVMSVTVPGLNVYYFGAREPLTVGELLFYWQD